MPKPPGVILGAGFVLGGSSRNDRALSAGIDRLRVRHGVRQVLGVGVQPAVVEVRQRDRAEQAARIRVRGAAKTPAHGAFLDDTAPMHHHDPFTAPRTTLRSCAMKASAKPHIALQLAQQVEDLRLGGDVEAGDDLVGQDELGLGDDRACDARALALAARQLVRIPVGEAGWQTSAIERSTALSSQIATRPRAHATVRRRRRRCCGAG